MPLFHLFLVAVIQGLTEFLPVSSSGHLILLPNLTGLEDQGQLIDVAVHVGTLGAVILYFWRDVAIGLRGLPRLATGNIADPGARLAFLLIIATIPVGVFGLWLKSTGLDDEMRTMKVIGWTMLGFGLVLYITDRFGATVKDDQTWSIKDAVLMGFAQAIALIPGTSRSGITISAGRWLGYDRHGSARLAMLMSIPTIAAIGIVSGAEVALKADAAAARDAAIAAALAFISALLALVLMMRLLRSVSFTPYVIYRVILGLILLWLAYT